MTNTKNYGIIGYKQRKGTNMGTRSTIKVEGQDKVKVYKHFDGYPKATLEWLEEFNKTFTKNRGDDPEYKFAQLLRSSIRDADKYNLDASEFTGWGVVGFDDSCGAEFKYILHKDGAVTYETL